MESKNPQDLIDAYVHLKVVAERLESKPRIVAKSTTLRTKKAKGRGGRGETARVIREIETSLMGTDFFANPRTTGETNERLRKVSRQSFTSRKVSQALGILWQKHLLKRVGKRNYYSYSK